MRSLIIRLQESLVLYKSFNALCFRPMSSHPRHRGNIICTWVGVLPVGYVQQQFQCDTHEKEYDGDGPWIILFAPFSTVFLLRAPIQYSLNCILHILSILCVLCILFISIFAYFWCSLLFFFSSLCDNIVLYISAAIYFLHTVYVFCPDHDISIISFYIICFFSSIKSQFLGLSRMNVC